MALLHYDYGLKFLIKFQTLTLEPKGGYRAQSDYPTASSKMDLNLESQHFLTKLESIHGQMIACQNEMRFFFPVIVNMVSDIIETKCNDREELTYRQQNLATKLNVWLRMITGKLQEPKRQLLNLSTLLLEREQKVVGGLPPFNDEGFAED